MAEEEGQGPFRGKPVVQPQLAARAGNVENLGSFAVKVALHRTGDVAVEANRVASVAAKNEKVGARHDRRDGREEGEQSPGPDRGDLQAMHRGIGLPVG